MTTDMIANAVTSSGVNAPVRHAMNKTMLLPAMMPLPS
jgi:hypothetical protein